MTPSSALRQALTGLLVAVAGCGPSLPAPPTVLPVSGTVLLAGKPVTSGQVQFTKDGDTTLTVIGDVQSDGTFTLQTKLIDGRKLPGAVAGTYRVTFNPPYGQDRKAALPVVTLTEPFVVKADGENRFTVKLDGAGSR